ncbi:MAG: HAMP domain-containing histidine kinase [Lachnospiraceae bacterium]|nr:HAMP domain-containing histidine kinase [Lachnospiraceae bacterium]
MAISVVLLMISACVLLFLIPRSRYGLPMFFMIIGVILTTLSVLFQYYSFGSYVPPAFLPFRSLDLLLHRFLGQSIRLPMPYMQTLRNLGVVIYLMGIAALTDIIHSNLMVPHRESEHTRLIVSRVSLALLCILYLFFYRSKSALRIYLMNIGHTGFPGVFLFFHQIISILVGIYMFYPLVLFIYNICKKNVTCFTSTKIILILSTLVTNIYFYYFIFISIFRNDPGEAIRSGFWFFNKTTKIPALYISVYPLFALIMLIFIIVNINGFFAVDLVSYSQNRILKKQIDDMNYNLKDVFHSEKNLMFSINILANEIKNDFGSAESKEKLDRIINISNEQMSALSKSLDSIKQLHIRPDAVDLRTLTDSAVNNAAIPEDITVIRKYCDYPALCTIDQYQTGHALSNLINNSVDSLMMSDSEDKQLEITIEASREWIYWSIRDNGLGIRKKDVRKLLMPFVSTKSKKANWGIGLPFAFKVIDMQLGQMKISGSTNPPHRYALVEILLPRRKKGNGKD